MRAAMLNTLGGPDAIELLDVPLPEVARWRVRDAVFGVRVGGDPRAESFALIAWLIDRVEQIIPITALNDSEEHLFQIIRGDAKRFLSARPELGRRCRVCGQGRVTVHWTRAGEVSTCDHCRDTVLLELSRPHSRLCAAGAHGVCESPECLCSCHQRSYSLFTVSPRRAPVEVLPLPPTVAVCAHSEFAAYVDDEGRHCGGCGTLLGGGGR